MRGSHGYPMPQTIMRKPVPCPNLGSAVVPLVQNLGSAVVPQVWSPVQSVFAPSTPTSVEEEPVCADRADRGSPALELPKFQPPSFNYPLPVPDSPTSLCASTEGLLTLASEFAVDLQSAFCGKTFASWPQVADTLEDGEDLPPTSASSDHPFPESQRGVPSPSGSSTCSYNVSDSEDEEDPEEDMDAGERRGTWEEETEEEVVEVVSASPDFPWDDDTEDEVMSFRPQAAARVFSVPTKEVLEASVRFDLDSSVGSAVSFGKHKELGRDKQGHQASWASLSAPEATSVPHPVFTWSLKCSSDCQDGSEMLSDDLNQFLPMNQSPDGGTGGCSQPWDGVSRACLHSSPVKRGASVHGIFGPSLPVPESPDSSPQTRLR